jgi:hypothetical protein
MPHRNRLAVPPGDRSADQTAAENSAVATQKQTTTSDAAPPALKKRERCKSDRDIAAAADGADPYKVVERGTPTSHDSDIDPGERASVEPCPK